MKFTSTRLSQLAQAFQENRDLILTMQQDTTPDFIDIYKKGSKISIKKQNRGKFTEAAKRAGMSVQEYANHIMANKDKYSSTLVKRANFARNASKFKH